MSRRLVLAVEIPDEVDLLDIGDAIRDSIFRADEDGRDDGRIRVDYVSEALGGWTVVDVDDHSTAAEMLWPSGRLLDRLTASRLPDGRVQVVSEGGADPDDDEATPDECFADLVLPAEQARTVGLALAAWSLR